MRVLCIVAGVVVGGGAILLLLLSFSSLNKSLGSNPKSSSTLAFFSTTGGLRYWSRVGAFLRGSPASLSATYCDCVRISLSTLS